MAASDAVTRVLFEDFTPSAVRLFYLVAYTAIAVFGYGIYLQVRKYRRGAPTGVTPGLWPRFESMLATVLLHRTVARRAPPARAAHRLVF
jgi:hypothetical protein